LRGEETVRREPLRLHPAAQGDILIVQLVPRAAPEPHCRLDVLERVTAAAFGQRRKMLRSSLRSLLPEPEGLLNELGIDPELRAEQLPVEAFARIAARFSA
jgi:16S rRNA (adenine1518-N6/adenine1519-N6)-dimethyltransferase